MSRREAALWHLDEADRLDRRAAELTDARKPPAVASISAMTPEWVEATLGADACREAATLHRMIAARIAKKGPRP